MEVNSINIGIGGIAGAGIMESGVIAAKTGLRQGLFAFVATDYPSLIKGGHNFTSIRLSSNPLTSHAESLDILVALNKETIDLHAPQIHTGTGIIYDSDDVSIQTNADSNAIYFGLPLSTFAKEAGGPDIIRNTAALGAVFAILKSDFTVLEAVLRDTFASKGDAVVQVNLKVARQAYEYIREHPGQPFGYTLEAQKPDKNRLLINGTQALSLGALRAGVQFVAIYPMTPVTNLLEFLAEQEQNYNLVVKEPEDELSAINMTVGASYAGARSLTGTSGGGFCLMTEGLSLAGATETPLVIVEGIRGGPSTGLPTHTEQSDLQFVLRAGHGDFPRVVLAPGDHVEAFQEIFNAFNLADKYQLPVVLITDKYLTSSHHAVTLPDTNDWIIDRGARAENLKPDQDFARYASTENGVSPRALPGQPDGIHLTTSYEHDDHGQTSENPEVHQSMMEKRMRKLDSLAKELPEPVLYGPETADITIIGWGSSKGPILEAINQLEAEGIKANYLHILYLAPFPTYIVAKTLDNAPQTLLVEGNYSGQLADLISEKTLRRVKHHLRQYTGKPFSAKDIVDKIKKITAQNKVATTSSFAGGSV